LQGFVSNGIPPVFTDFALTNLHPQQGRREIVDLTDLQEELAHWTRFDKRTCTCYKRTI